MESGRRGRPCALKVVALLLAASCGSVTEGDQDASDGGAGADGAVDGGSGPGRAFLYVSNFGSDDLSVFEVDPDDGSLTSGPTVTTGEDPFSVTVDRSGRFLYVVSTAESAVYQYAIDQETGVPVAMSPASVATGAGPMWIISPGTDYLYVANGDDENISGYEIDAESGQLTELADSPFSVGPGNLQIKRPRYTVADADDSSLVIGLETEDGADRELRIFPIESGSGNLAEPAVESVGAQPFPIMGASDPAHEFFFAILRETNQVQAYRIDDPPDLVPAGEALDTGNDPFGVAVHPEEPHLYVTNFADDSVSFYRYDESGELTFVSAAATGEGPEVLAFAFGGRFLYTPNFGTLEEEGTVSQFEIDRETGVPAPIDAPPAPAGTNPIGMASVTLGGP